MKPHLLSSGTKPARGVEVATRRRREVTAWWHPLSTAFSPVRRRPLFLPFSRHRVSLDLEQPPAFPDARWILDSTVLGGRGRGRRGPGRPEAWGPGAGRGCRGGRGRRSWCSSRGSGWWRGAAAAAGGPGLAPAPAARSRPSGRRWRSTAGATASTAGPCSAASVGATSPATTRRSGSGSAASRPGRRPRSRPCATTRAGRGASRGSSTARCTTSSRGALSVMRPCPSPRRRLMCPDKRAPSTAQKLPTVPLV